MAAPIETHSVKHNHGGMAGKADQVKGGMPPVGAPLAGLVDTGANAHDDQINISKTAMQLSHARASDTPGSQMTREAALAMVASIREQMVENSQQMMMAQSGKGNNGLLELLRQPA